jgi:hypothetical protein
MTRLSDLIERLRGGRRPPTGPLTASEQTAAEQTAAEQTAAEQTAGEESGRESQATNDEGAAHEEEEKLTP